MTKEEQRQLYYLQEYRKGNLKLIPEEVKVFEETEKKYDTHRTS